MKKNCGREKDRKTTTAESPEREVAKKKKIMNQDYRSQREVGKDAEGSLLTWAKKKVRAPKRLGQRNRRRRARKS